MIHLSHVSKSYKTSTRPALDDVSVDVDKGEFCFLIGPSGSGKSTFLRLLLREDTPTTGEIEVAGQDLNRSAGRKSRSTGAPWAASSRTSGCCRTRPWPRTSASRSR